MFRFLRQPNVVYELERMFTEANLRGDELGGLNRDSIELVKTEGGPLAWLGMAGLLRSAARAKRPEGLGTEPTEPGEFPDVVAVGDLKEFWASGILLKGGYVLTAGHVHALKVRDRVSIGVKAPISLLCPDGTCPTGRTLGDADNSVEKRVISHLRHPFFWNDPYFHNDLAVLKLDWPDDDHDLPQGIDLDALASAKNFKNAKFGRMVGFGTSNRAGSNGYGIQGKVDIPILHGEEMADRYGFGKHLGFDWRREFVAAAPFLDKDACSGDSGGGFFVKVCCDWKLIGMVSRQFGLRGKQCGAGSIYLRIDKYRDCIKTMIEMLEGGHSDLQHVREKLRDSCPDESAESYDTASVREPTPCPSCSTKEVDDTSSRLRQPPG